MTNADNLAIALDLDRMMRFLDCVARPRARAIDPIGIGPFGAMVLSSIADLEPVTMQTLTRQLARDKAQMTRTVQTLEREGLVTKERSPDDGRVTVLALTEPGRSLATQFHGLLGDIVGELLDQLSDTERRQFGSLLAKVVASQRTDDPAPEGSLTKDER